MPKIFLSQMSLFPLPISSVIEMAEASGFDGVEVFNFNLTHEKMEKIIVRAKKFGLDVHLHQAWRYEDDPTKINWLMNKLGFLPKYGKSVRAQFDGITEPVVAYPDEWNCVRDEDDSNFWLQTNLSHGPNGMKMPLRKFYEIVKNNNFPVVFDTQHFLEDCVGKNGVEFISTDRKIVLKNTIDGWGNLHRFVKEIHLCDFDPNLGSQKGRNLFLGKGIFPLKRFAEIVKETKWDGFVVPEVKPQHILGLRRLPMLEKLAKLRRITRDLFK